MEAHDFSPSSWEAESDPVLKKEEKTWVIYNPEEGSDLTLVMQQISDFQTQEPKEIKSCGL